jgi:hypothetical protein
MRFRTVVLTIVALALAGSFAADASATRLKSFTFCGPKECWSTPASMTGGRDVVDIGRPTKRPAFPVRYYRVEFQYAPTGRTTGLFMPSLGTFRHEGRWWKVPRRTAEALRRVTHLLQAFGPRKF